MVLVQEVDLAVEQTNEADSRPLLEIMADSPIYVERDAAQIMLERIENADNWSISPRQLRNQIANYNASLLALHKLVTNEHMTEDEEKRARGLQAEVCVHTLFGNLEEFDIFISPGSAYSDINGIDFAISVGDIMYHIDVTTSEWNELAEKYAQNHTVAIFPLYDDERDARVVPDGEKKDAFIEYANNQLPLAINAYASLTRQEVLVKLADYNCTLAKRHEKNPNWRTGALKSREFWESIRANLSNKTTELSDSL